LKVREQGYVLQEGDKKFMELVQELYILQELIEGHIEEYFKEQALYAMEQEPRAQARAIAPRAFMGEEVEKRALKASQTQGHLQDCTLIHHHRQNQTTYPFLTFY